MRKDAAHKIEQEFFRKIETNKLFKQYVDLHPDSSMEETLAGWKWVEALVEKAIRRTIRDLTCAPPAPTLNMQRER